ncbi:MAG: hypothetical protein LC664_11265 [Flavobacteriales bacterium]|nr:hypothetical protein [Flavobacteriales bacterium]
MRFTSEIEDLGDVSATDTLAFSFVFSGSENLIVDSLVYDREVITIGSAAPPFGADQSAIEGKLHPGNQSGKRNAIIAIFGNFAAEKRELNITYEIKENR